MSYLRKHNVISHPAQIQIPLSVIIRAMYKLKYGSSTLPTLLLKDLFISLHLVDIRI